MSSRQDRLQDDAMAVAYINHQGDISSHPLQRVALTPSWAELHITNLYPPSISKALKVDR